MVTTITGKPDPLAPFIRLAPSIYCVEPRIKVQNDSKGPSTIILAFWMNAPPRAAVKYVTRYTELVPSARILFILTNTRDFYSSRASRQLRLKSLIDILASSSSSPKADASIYIHLFSNGGFFAIAELLRAYKTSNGNPLPVSSIVIDSAPGIPTPPLSIKALSFGLPQTIILRQLGYALLFTIIWGMYLTRKPLSLIWRWLWKRPGPNDDVIVYGDDPLAYTRKSILDPDLIVAGSSKKNINMCYIYSDADELVPSKDVEQHAALAMKRPLQTDRIVRLEKFTGSPHVGHMMLDPVRYWSIVEKCLSF